MSIFESLKNAIFGSHAPAPTPVSTPPSATSGAPRSAAPAAAPPKAPAEDNPPRTKVDIAAVLSQRAAQKHEKLNWQTSIVDLMKLVDLDPSLENRKTLAKELGYTGNTQDSATMNVWLHKEVMNRLAASGGNVPDSLRH